MKPAEVARLIAVAAAIDPRVPPLATNGTDERVAVWGEVLEGLDYRTCDRALLAIARDPQMVTLRPGDIYQEAKRIMRRNLDRVEVASIEPPDDATGPKFLEWRRALVRALGRGEDPEVARIEADREVGATRRAITPSPSNRRKLEGVLGGPMKPQKTRGGTNHPHHR
ncbi:hypothetical protein M3D53_09835 [Dermabacter hominis]|uniref:hypothetical protein n=1 Tax=Dermabacter hominis TaxID=36740 RepID=UPI0021A93920|nr:hypothetical protein [Dermabacter hominis]MCT2056929.1 hypothetical protein [Dermabacter hominis]MCT2084404.1 hypothetical protein [Dermabacter hominis]MCT2091765.1 hypothetical protein [Dermabacter hominis]MCT2190808.1 hypothetical protein [Dermabacter hominis]MCT2227961.1 hypothetical protein [Dermabacter hominis]